MAVNKQGFMVASYIIMLSIITHSIITLQLATYYNGISVHYLVIMGLILLAAEFNFNQLQIPFFSLTS